MAQQQTYHIEIDEGTDFFHVFTLSDITTGIPQDLTNYSARMDVRAFDYNAQNNVIMPISYDSLVVEVLRGITLGTTSGTIRLDIPAADTLSSGWLGGTTGTYDIFLIDPDGGKTKFIKGFFTIKPSTTKLI